MFQEHYVAELPAARTRERRVPGGSYEIGPFFRTGLLQLLSGMHGMSSGARAQVRVEEQLATFMAKLEERSAHQEQLISRLGLQQEQLYSRNTGRSTGEAG